MLSKFEDLHIRLHPDYVLKLSAFSRWPWATNDGSSPLTEHEIISMSKHIDKEYPRGEANKFNTWTRNYELLKICWLIHNFDSSKTSIYFGFLKGLDIEHHTIEDGNHTLAACAYLKHSPWIRVNTCPATLIRQLIKNKVILECNCDLKYKSVLGGNVVSFSKRHTYSFIYNAKEQCLSIDKLDADSLNIIYDSEEFGYMGFTDSYPVVVKNKVIECKPDEKLLVFLQEMEKATGNPFTELYEDCKLRYERGIMQ